MLAHYAALREDNSGCGQSRECRIVQQRDYSTESVVQAMKRKLQEHGKTPAAVVGLYNSAYSYIRQYAWPVNICNWSRGLIIPRSK